MSEHYIEVRAIKLDHAEPIASGPLRFNDQMPGFYFDAEMTVRIAMNCLSLYERVAAPRAPQDEPMEIPAQLIQNIGDIGTMLSFCEKEIQDRMTAKEENNTEVAT